MPEESVPVGVTLTSVDEPVARLVRNRFAGGVGGAFGKGARLPLAGAVSEIGGVGLAVKSSALLR